MQPSTNLFGDASSERIEQEKRNATAAPVDTQSAAQRECSDLRGNTHAETEQISKLFVTTPCTSVIDWNATLQARKNLQASLARQQAVRRFVR